MLSNIFEIQLIETNNTHAFGLTANRTAFHFTCTRILFSFYFLSIILFICG